jgi:phosphoserine phosphatase RsbU/P
VSLGLVNAAIISIFYTLLIFLIAWHAHSRKEAGKSIVGSPYVYTLSIAVYCTSWTFYGSVGKAADSGLSFLMIYLGPTLCIFLWIFLLRRVVKISKDNNITNIADFISLRYGKSLWLGALVTVLVITGTMPYIALQIKAVSTSFYLISGFGSDSIRILEANPGLNLPTGLVLTIILAVFSVVFGARRLVSSERHEGLIAAVAFESTVKLFALFGVGVFVTYYLFDGFINIFEVFRELHPDSFNQLLTLPLTSQPTGQISSFTMLFLSMGSFMLLPRQFHVMVIENSDVKHIDKAMWLFPLYLLLIAVFIMPIALAGIIMTGSSEGAEYFAISLPLLTGNENIAKLAFLGGLSAAAGMVMVESIAISSMLLNNIFMPVIVKFRPQAWFPLLLINLKRAGIFLVIFSGYIYYRTAGESLQLAEMGFISLAASCQLLPAFLGALFWKRGNKTGAFTGIAAGFVTWLYTLLIPSFKDIIWFQTTFIDSGLFGIPLLRPTSLFGMTGLDMWSHSLFWSMFFNISAYIIFSVVCGQEEGERDQIRKFCFTTEAERRQYNNPDAKRLTKPVTIGKFINLLSKFIGENEAENAIKNYLGSRSVDLNGYVSEFELPNLKRFTEKTLAGSVGAAAAGAIVDSFLSDMGSRMESVYNIFSSVRSSLDQSREALYVRLKASEIINRTLDIQIIMNDLLALLSKEFKLDIALIMLKNNNNKLIISSYLENSELINNYPYWLDESSPYFDMAVFDCKSHFVNDTIVASDFIKLNRTLEAGICSFCVIPICREPGNALGIIAIYSRTIKGLFTVEFIDLLSSLAGQLAQAITIINEVEEKNKERSQKESALLVNARVKKEMEIAQQIQLSLLPGSAPLIPGIEIDGRCISAAHVGGDYYDYFQNDNCTLDILIADVSGHSIGAALIMAEVRTLLRLNLESSFNASKLLKDLNKQLYSDLSRVELYISIFYARYNHQKKVLSYANAGHNPPIVCRDGYTSPIDLDADGLIIGVMEDVTFIEQTIELLTGDAIIFYTDGLVEASKPSGEMFGTNRIFEAIARLKQLPINEIIDCLYLEVRQFTGQDALQDDISIIIFKVN